MSTVDITDYSGADPTGVTHSNDAFAAFRTAKAGQTGVILTMGPPGSTYLLNASDTGGGPWSIPRGILGLTVVGNNTTITSGGAGSVKFKPGVDGTVGPSGGVTYGRVRTALAGATSLTVATLADAANFTANTYGLLIGLDLQPGGTPQNPHWFEYPYFTNVDLVTGIITLRDPLRYTYKETWPSYGDPFFGGPATLFNLVDGWDAEVEYQNITFNQDSADTGPGCAIRQIIFTNCVDNGPHGPFPGNNLLWKCVGCSFPNAATEVDKMVTEMVVDSTTWKRINVQSSSGDLLTIQNGSTITERINGTPKKTVISADSRVAILGVGATSYGCSEEVILQGPSIITSSLGVASVTDKGAGDVGVNNDAAFSMSGGIIRVTKATVHNEFIPGAWLMWNALHENERLFRVLDVYEDGSYVYVVTNLTGGFPSVPLTNPANALFIRAHPAPRFTWLGTGYRAGLPLYSDSGPTTLDKSLGAGTQFLESVWGALKSITFDITTPYTGIQSDLFFHLAQNNNWPVLDASDADTNYGPILDMTVGPRTVVVTPSGITGNVGTDTFTGSGAFPANGWFTGGPNSGASFSRDVSGESAGPVVTVTIQTDQGIFQSSVAPLRLRLHA